MRTSPLASALTLSALAVALAISGCARAGNESMPARQEIQVGSSGFEPARVPARAGQEVVLVFTRTTDRTCATEVVIPSENRTVALPLNQPVEVKITPREKGEIAFTCGMKMFQGVVNVQ